MIIRTAAVLVSFGLFAGPACANSFLAVAPPDATPSILALASDTASLGPSMIAMGDPEPAVSNENVASVSSDEKEPILIRGGIASTGNPSAPVEVTPAASGGGDGSTKHYASKVAEKHALRKAVRDANREAEANPQPASPPQPTRMQTAKPQ